MRLVVAACAISLGLALGACSSTGKTPAPDLPLTVAHGVGSEFGNYAAQKEGEMRGPSGERCVVFYWDRPLTNGLGVRTRSASCEDKGHAGRMVAMEISRRVVPIAETGLGRELAEAGR
jgi:hypothetical protein